MGYGISIVSDDIVYSVGLSDGYVVPSDVLYVILYFLA